MRVAGVDGTRGGWVAILLEDGRFAADLALTPIDTSFDELGDVDVIAVDMETRRIVKRVEGVEQGRTNNSLIVSSDGTKLYVGGVGDTIQVYDARTLAHVKDIFAGGDFMMSPIAVPRAAAVSVP